MRIFDTAGMRKKARISDKLEKMSVSDGLRAVRFAEVVVVLLDVDIPFEQQDLRIADFAESEGRAVVVAANKWDLEDEKTEKLKELREAFERLCRNFGVRLWSRFRPRPARGSTGFMGPSSRPMMSGTGG